MIKPLPGYCLIQPIEDDKKTVGGVYLPESSQDKPMKGKVISVGDSIQHYNGDLGMMTAELEKSPAEKGQIVVYKKWTNQEVDHEGKKYLLVKFDELLAIIE